MFISLSWLREYVDLPKKIDIAEFAKLITLRSAEVEKIVDQSATFENMVVGKVVKLQPHPDADRLQVVGVDIGKSKPVQVVCGGTNLKIGLLVAMALPGAKAKWHGEEEVEITLAKVRGQESNGMICAGEEIGLEPDNAAGQPVRIKDLSHLKAKPGTPLGEALGLDDIVIEFDNKALTHRPDLWGHRGMAREIAAITGAPFKDKKLELKWPTRGEVPKIKVEAPELCPRYMALIIRGVKVEESPDWLKKRLLATDHSVISNIVDVTNYVMEEIGQPLHAFDLRKVADGIVVRTARKAETLTTLDGEEKRLDESTLVIADKKKALALAGVMGGQDSGIGGDTVDILLESANFDPISVRQSSVKHGLRSDSVQRFEKSLDPQLCERALWRAAELILELCPKATLAGPPADIANFEVHEPIVKVKVDRIQNKIGVPIPATEMAAYLEMLHFEVQGKVTDSSQEFSVKVPSYRATKDVDMEEDIVEEVARMVGYENIPATLPALPTQAPAPNPERSHKHQTRSILAQSLKLTECANYSFYGAATLSRFGLDEKTHFKLLNVLSEEQSHLRCTLIPNLVTSLAEATKHDPEPALFELGRVYFKEQSFMPKEEKHLAMALVSLDEKTAFFKAKGILEAYLREFGVSGLQIQEAKSPTDHVHPHQAADLILRGKPLGSLFTLHPALSEGLDLPGRVACFELNFGALSQAAQPVKKFQMPSKFPGIAFDVSVLVDQKTAVAQLETALKKALPQLLKSMELFDSYQGDKIEAGKKSLAFRLTLQAEDRTLTGSDLEEAQKKAWLALEKAGGKIRGK